MGWKNDKGRQSEDFDFGEKRLPVREILRHPGILVLVKTIIHLRHSIQHMVWTLRCISDADDGRRGQPLQIGGGLNDNDKLHIGCVPGIDCPEKAFFVFPSISAMDLFQYLVLTIQRGPE